MHVVASVGTDHHPFTRMIEWVTDAQRQVDFTFTVQSGSTPTDGAVGGSFVPFFSTEDLIEELTKATVVISHGGPGTISLAMRCGHRPIVIARNPALGEHVDDHQQRYVRRLAAEGAIDSPETFEDLVSLLRHPELRPPHRPLADVNPEVAATRFGTLVDQLIEDQLPLRRWRDRILIRRTL